MATTARRYWEHKAVMEMARAGSDFLVNLFFPLPLTEEPSFSGFVFRFVLVFFHGDSPLTC